MVTAAIYLPEPLPMGGEHAQDCLIRIGQRGYHFTGEFLRNPTALERCLKERTAEVVVIGHQEHRPFDLHADDVTVLAPVFSLDRRRSETTTRRLGPVRSNAATRHHQTGDCVPIRTAEQRITDAVRRWTTEFSTRRLNE